MKLLRIIILLASFFPTHVKAAFPVGQWTVASYVASTGLYWNTADICLKGNGSWYMVEQNKGSGNWIQKGGMVYLHGNIVLSSNVLLNYSAELHFVHSKLLTGYESQWSDNVLPGKGNVVDNLFTTTAFTFKSPTCLAPF